MAKKEEKSQRIEALMRIPIGIISYIITYLWTFLIMILILIQFLHVLITTKKNKPIAHFSNQYISYLYSVWRYMTFTTDKRPFPFNEIQKPFEKVE